MASKHTMKPGYTFVNEGGTIWKTREANGALVPLPYQEFAVFDCLQKRTPNNTYDFWITLSSTGLAATQNPGYRVGDTVCYNTKGTNNHNADNTLPVVEVQGQLVIRCQGPQLRA